MFAGKLVFAQLMEFLPRHEFDKCVQHYRGNNRLRRFSCRDQFLAMAFAQLTYRESLRDIETCLRSLQPKLYHLGFRSRVARSTLADAKTPGAQILREVAACGFDEDARFGIKLALEEALNNAVRHGNHEDPNKRIIVRYCVTPETVTICVRDEGEGFCPGGIPDPTSPDRISLPSGRGIMLMRAYMSDVHYRCNGREVVTDVYNYPSGSEGILLDKRDPNLARQNPADYIKGFAATVRAVMQEAHPMHFFGSRYALPLTIIIASAGQSSRQTPHPMQFFLMINGATAAC